MTRNSPGAVKAAALKHFQHGRHARAVGRCDEMNVAAEPFEHPGNMEALPSGSVLAQKRTICSADGQAFKMDIPVYAGGQPGHRDHALHLLPHFDGYAVLRHEISRKKIRISSGNRG